jgi:hypothetical protein
MSCALLIKKCIHLTASVDMTCSGCGKAASARAFVYKEPGTKPPACPRPSSTGIPAGQLPLMELFEHKGDTTMNYWPAPKAFWKRLRSKWPAGKRTGEMGLLKDHLRCISEKEWMWWRRLLNLAYEMTTECPFERWKYTELISLQKEIGNDDTAKQRPIQLMDCMANTWNAAGIKKLDNRRESEQYKSDMQVGFTRNKSPWHVHHRVYHTAMEGQRFNEYKGQFMYIALDDAMRCFDAMCCLLWLDRARILCECRRTSRNRRYAPAGHLLRGVWPSIMYNDHAL